MSIESNATAREPLAVAGGGDCVMLQVTPRTAKVLRAIQEERDKAKSAAIKLAREVEWLRGERTRMQKELDAYSWRDNPGQGMY